MNRLVIWFALALAFPDQLAHAQNGAGSLDLRFVPAVPDVAPRLVALQKSGKIVIAGEFTRVNDTRRFRLAQLKSDGSLDENFDPGEGANDPINALALQREGKVLIGGSFTGVNGVPRAGLARLNADGSVDTSFQPGTPPARNVYALVVQPDGRILVAGRYADLDGADHLSVARLNPDGSLDASFGNGSGISTNGSVAILTLQPDGKILLGGVFSRVNGSTSVNGTPVFVLVRVDSSGTLDSSFAPSVARDPVSAAYLPDGKVLYERVIVGIVPPVFFALSRLNLDGSQDSSYGGGAEEINPVLVLDSMRSVIVQPDGKVLLGGGRRESDDRGGIIDKVVRLDADGKLDPSFTPAQLASPRDATLQSDGKLIVVGDFAHVNGVARPGIARLNNDAGGASSFFTGAVPVGGGFDYLAFIDLQESKMTR